MRRGTFVTAVTLGVTVAACGQGADDVRPGELNVTVDTTESGVVVVRSRGDAPGWTIQEVFTIGDTATGDIQDAVSLAVDRTDAIWVADAGTQQIKVFGPEGNLIRLVGNRGSGPGEFRDLRSIAFLGSNVLALDVGNDRVDEISLSGSWRGERPSPYAGTGSPPARRLYPVGPAEVYEWSVRDGDAGPEPVWVRHSIRPETDTRPAYDATAAPVITCEAQGVRSTFPAPFQPRQLEYPAEGGLVATAWTAEYRVAFVSPEGDTVRVVERERPASPVTDEAWEAELAPYRQVRAKRPGAACDPPEPARPDASPPIHDLMIDVAGRLLVEAETPSGRVWDVYDLTGYPLGTFPAFERAADVPPYVTTEGIVWVTEDTRSGERVALARIVR